MLLKVLQPPAAPCRFDGGKPSAGEIKHGDGDGPYQIKERQAPDIARWRWRVAHGMVGKQPGIYSTEPDPGNQQRQQVNERNVKYIVEEWNPPKNSDHASKKPVGPLQ